MNILEETKNIIDRLDRNSESESIIDERKRKFEKYLTLNLFLEKIGARRNVPKFYKLNDELLANINDFNQINIAINWFVEQITNLEIDDNNGLINFFYGMKYNPKKLSFESTTKYMELLRKTIYFDLLKNGSCTLTTNSLYTCNELANICYFSNVPYDNLPRPLELIVNETIVKYRIGYGEDPEGKTDEEIQLLLSKGLRILPYTVLWKRNSKTYQK